VVSQGRDRTPVDRTSVDRTSVETDTRDLARGAGVNYLGSVARIAPRAIFLVMAGRLYGQEGFGAYTFGITVVETAAAIALFGMKRSLFRFMSEATARGETVHRPIANGIAFTVTAGLMLTLLVGFGGGALATAFGLGTAVRPLLVLTLAIPMIVLSDILLVAIRFTRQMRFEVYARSLIEPIVLTVALMVVYWAGARELGLAVAYVTSLLAAVVASALFFVRVFSLPECLRVRLRWGEIRHLAAFSGPTAGYEFFLMLADKADIFLVSYFAPVSTVGIYGMARQFSTITKKLRAGFDRILPPVFSESIAANDLGRANQQLAMVARWIMTAELLVVLLFVFFGEAILGFVDAGFVAAATVVVLLMIGDAFHGSLGVSELPFVYLRPPANIPFGVLMLALTTGLGAFLIRGFGAEGAAMAVLVTAVVVNGIRMLASRWMFGLSVVQANILKPLAAAGVAAGVVWVFRWMVGGVPVVGSLVGLPLLFVTYGGMLYLLGLEPEDRSQVGRLLARFK
jgi:O-antigen/teichoic acid export membrane protein